MLYLSIHLYLHLSTYLSISIYIYIYIYAVLANVYTPVSNYYHPRMHCISTHGFSHAAVDPAWAYAVYPAKCAYLGLGTYGYPHLMFGTSILGVIVGKVVVVNGYCQVFPSFW